MSNDSELPQPNPVDIVGNIAKNLPGSQAIHGLDESFRRHYRLTRRLRQNSPPTTYGDLQNLTYGQLEDMSPAEISDVIAQQSSTELNHGSTIIEMLEADRDSAKSWNLWMLGITIGSIILGIVLGGASLWVGVLGLQGA
ncbi:hypothetical protein [Nocardiopsis sp. Huas11]|uniref:hypothetical protein n=1 Tax=Nocardiopsis sp. Huas11 TaxID=2183912 RepID=UPI0011C443B6|nr:hypothetical protein [Nocardiopsis sp. Huas11]